MSVDILQADPPQAWRMFWAASIPSMTEYDRLMGITIGMLVGAVVTAWYWKRVGVLE